MRVKQFVVMGLGKFGSSVAQTLYISGNDILAIDMDMQKVEEAAKLRINAVQADVTDREAMYKLGLNNFDVAIVSIGSNMEASILATLFLKELGVPYVISKAHSEMHEKVLEKIGADRVVFPEREMGIRIATNVLNSNILDYIQLSSDYRVLEILVKQEWVGKTIAELNLRREHDINIIAIKNKNSDTVVSPNPEYPFKEEDVIVAIILDPNNQSAIVSI